MRRRTARSESRLRGLWSRLLVLVLVLPIAISQWSPIFARLVSGPPVHVCHCDTQGPHAECACPICSPGRDDLVSDDVAVRGSCGDEATAPGKAVVTPVVLAPASALIPYSSRAPRVARTDLPRIAPVLEPPTPPPRARAVFPA